MAFAIDSGDPRAPRMSTYLVLCRIDKRQGVWHRQSLMMMNEWNRQLCLFSSTSVDISVKSGKHEQKSTYKFNLKRYKRLQSSARGTKDESSMAVFLVQQHVLDSLERKRGCAA